jgi:two-component system response regulator YesN
MLLFLHHEEQNNIMNNNFQKNMYLPVLFSSCTLVIIVLILSLTLTAGRYEREAIENSFLEQIDNLQKSAADLDRIHKSLRALVIQLYFDNNISNLRSLKNPDPIEMNRAFTKISYAGAVLPYVESIYILSNYSQKIYHIIPFGLSREYQLALFPDYSAIDYFESNRETMKIIPRSIPQWHNSRKNDFYQGFTFTFSTDGSRKNSDEGGIIINLSQNVFIKAMETYHKSESTRGFIFSQDGKELLNGDVMDNDEIFEKYQKSSLSSNSGYFMGDRNGKKTLFVYMSYQPFHWILINAIPYPDIVKGIRHTRLLTILSGVITLILSLLLAYFLTRTAYKPIEEKLKKIREMERIAVAEKQKRKEEFLLSIIRDGQPVPEKSDFPDFEIGLELHNPLQLLLVMPDNLSSLKIEKQINDMTLFFRKSGLAEGIYLNERRFLIIIQISERSLSDIIDEFQKTINADEDSCSFVVSDPLSLDSHLPQTFKSMIQAGYSRFFSGQRSLISIDSWKKREDSEICYPLKWEKDLCHSLTNKSGKEMGEIYHSFISHYHNSTVLKLKHSLERLCSPLFNIISIMEKKSGTLFPLSFEEVVESIERSQFLGEVDLLFISLFQRIEDFRERGYEQKNKKLVSDVQEIIKQDYTNPLLGMDDAARKLGISAGYLGRIYKGETGHSLIEYINIVRIEEAKALLQEKSISIKEVSRKTGYASTQHFHRVFKKYTGFSPSYYKTSVEK